jgi:hypothetical protein
MNTLFSEEISPKQVPNYFTHTQPKEFLMDSIVDPSVIPIDQSLKLTPTAYVQNPMVFEPMKSAQQPSIVGGLFNPELRSAAEADYLQRRQDAMKNEAMAFAQLTPAQQAQFGFYRGGQQLGDAIGGALGVQDPQLKMIAMTQQIAQGADLSNPESLYQTAQKFAQIGNLTMAKQYADQAKVLQESITKQIQEKASAGKSVAETAKLLSEAQNKESTIQGLMSRFNLSKEDATTIAGNAQLLEKYLTPATSQAFEILKTGKFTPESVAAFANTGNLSKLDSFDMSAKPSEPWLEVARELKLPAKKSFNDYSPEEVALVNKKLFDREIEKAKATAANIRVGVDVKAQEAGATESARLDAKRVDEARTAASKALEQKQILSAMQQALPNIVSGTGAQARTSFLNLLQTVGLASPEDQNKLASSELFNSLAGERVLSFIKTLGTNPTDTDREFARTIGPALEKGTKSNKDIIDYLTKRADSIINNASAMESHYYDNKYSLKGFKPSTEVIPITTPSQSGWSIKKKP